MAQAQATNAAAHALLEGLAPLARQTAHRRALEAGADGAELAAIAAGLEAECAGLEARAREAAPEPSALRLATAQIEMHERRRQEGPGEGPAGLRALEAHLRLEESVRDAERTLARLRGVTAQRRTQLEWQQDVNRELEAVQQTLQKRAERGPAAVDADSGDDGDDDDEDPASLKEATAALSEELVAFVGAHFAPRLPKKRKARDDDAALFSMEALLEALINRALSDPADPYIDVVDKGWDEYLGILAEASIAERDPDNATRWRFVKV